MMYVDSARYRVLIKRLLQDSLLNKAKHAMGKGDNNNV